METDQPIPRKGKCGLTEVVSEKIDYTGHERQCGLVGNLPDGGSGDLGSGPIPDTHPRGDHAWPLPPPRVPLLHLYNGDLAMPWGDSYGAWPG